MARQLVIAVVVAVAGSQLGACSSTDDDDDDYWCYGGGGPSMPIRGYVSFSAADLTCTRLDSELACSGACCRLTNITTRPVACDGPCVTLDETSCASDTRCFVARDFTAFYTGAPDRFLGCFPKTPFSSRGGCEERDATTCAFDARCAGLYHASSPAKFVECIDEALIAGSCTEVATCMEQPPRCPADRTPGVAAGCYTGACIPNDLCAP